MTKHSWYHFSPDGAATEAKTLGNALELRKAGRFVWLAYSSPARDDLAPLIDLLGIHPLSIDDCFDDDYLPKMDIFPEYTGILFNDFLKEDGEVAVREINFFLGKDFLVSVLRDGSADLHRSGAILETLALDTAGATLGPARVLHAILDRIVDNTFASVESIGDQLSALEDLVLAEDGSVKNSELQRIRKNLMILRKSLFHEREVLARICRRDSPMIRGEDVAYFSNLYDHLAKFVELVESNRETATNLVQIQLSLSSNAMAESANRTNRSVNRLTLITTIFMPLSLLAGIGGMSEWTMMTGPENWRIAYPVLLGLMAAVGIANFIVLKWLQRKK